jgi:NADH-quinone oxidoreductase subunit L
MVMPLLILAVAAVLAGYLTNPTAGYGIVDSHSFGHFVTENHEVFETEAAVEHAGAAAEFNYGIAILSTLVALSGIALAFAMYQANVISPANLTARFKPVHRILINKYYMDELYEDIIVNKIFYNRFAKRLASFDITIIDGVNVQLASWTRRFSGVLGFIQDGQLQTYGAVASAGAVVVLAVFLFWV